MIEGIILISVFLLVWVLIGGERADIEKLVENRVVQETMELSYFGQEKKLVNIGRKYSLKQYFRDSFKLLVFFGFLIYRTVDDLYLSLWICGVIIFFWPYLYCLKVMNEEQRKKEESAFIYSQSILVYLRENRVSQQILYQCVEVLEGAFRTDIEKMISVVEQSNQFSKGLKMLEDKYPYSMIKNVHILLLGKKDQGSSYLSLVDYLQKSIENHEILLREFYRKKERNEKMFFIICGLNFIAISMIIKFFVGTSEMSLGIGIKIVLSCFYSLNLITIVLYERWCLTKNHLD